MKKVLFMLAAAALVFVSCEKEVSSITSISIDDEITLLAGTEEIVPLNLSWEPAEQTIDYAKVQWTSSDEAVVTVDADGGLLALAAGTATITATYEGLSDNCLVTVIDDERQLLTFPLGALLQDPLGLLTDLAFEITNPATGTIDSCGLALARVPIFGDGFYVDSEGYITGAGYMINAYTLVYYFIDGESMGIYGPRKGYELLSATDNPYAGYGDCSTDDIKYYILPQGIFDVQTYGAIEEKMYLLGEELTEEEEEAYSASRGYGDIFYIDYINQKQYVSEGQLGTGYFFEPRTENEARHYDFTINWWTGWHGLAVTEDGTDLVRPYELAPFVEYRYTLGAEVAGAPAKAMKAPKGQLLKKQPERFKANAVTIK